MLSLALVLLAYFSLSAIQTLALPYYEQSDVYTQGAPLPYIFERRGWIWAKWVVSIGALNGLSTSLLGCMYPLPRVMYAMGSDGLIFRFFAYVHPYTKTPMISCLFAGVFAGIMSCFFNIVQLADMMSIGMKYEILFIIECKFVIVLTFCRNSIGVYFSGGIYSNHKVNKIICLHLRRLFECTLSEEEVNNEYYIFV